MAQQNENYMAKQFTGLPLKSLIGAPLKAATDANGMIAKAQTALLLDTCFEPGDGEGDSLKPIMLSFDIERSIIDKDGKTLPETAKMRVSLPLLTLIPINSMAVETLKVSFEMEVRSSTEHKSQSGGQQGGSDEDDEFGTQMYGSVAKSGKSEQSGKNSATAHYEIELQAGQLPLPKGLTTIIDAFSKNIAPIAVKQ
jgi:hypothetical protein